MTPRLRRRPVVDGTLLLTLAAILTHQIPLLALGTQPDHAITVDAAAHRGLVRPYTVGQMMEWAQPNMNKAWAEKLQDRSIEGESVLSRRSPLYDAFAGSSLDRSKWTPMSLDNAPAGTISVQNSRVSITAAQDGRFGIMSNDVQGSQYAGYNVEVRVVSYTGLNVILSVYGGTGAGDFSKFVEFAIEGGVLKVFADGQPTWTGGSASTPADLRIEMGPLNDGTRDFKFYYNGSLVHTLSGFSQLPDPFRVFLYGWNGTVTYEHVTIDPDDTYDGFYASSLSPRWSITRLAGNSNGTVSVGSGLLTINGGSNSRYGVLSDYIRNSAIDWTTLDVRLSSYSGTNALINIYGGSGGFTNFIEFGVENNVLKVFTSEGTGNWSGSTVTLPATLTVRVSPYYANGRRFQFFLNGSRVYELTDRKDVPAGDFRIFLYGWSTSTTKWDWVNVSQRHMWDPFAPHFEGGPGLSVEWTGISLAGGWGSASQGSSQLTINGATDSRYGVISPPLDESDIYGYVVEAKLDSYSGTNGLVNIYAGSGRGDFSKFIEFGIEGGTLRVFGDGIPSWTGPSASTPAVLRIEVGPWTPSGRDFYFYYNDRLVHWLEDITVIPSQNWHVFVYGWSTSVTRWDYVTWWRQNPFWAEDGFADRALYTHERSAYNGRYSQRIDITQHTDGRKGISQRGIAVTAGRDYQVSAYLKQSNLTAPVTVHLGPAEGDGPGYTPYASASISSVGTGWARYTVSLTPNTTDQQAKLFIGTSGTGTLWVDMVSVMPLDPAEVAYGGWRKDFIDRLVALNPKHIRWPGGIIADWYHWQDGVGARDSRPPMYYAQWDAQWLTNDVGTHEILDLAEQLGLGVTLNVNWGTGSSTEAASWVEYTNGASGTTYGNLRIANGRSQPWNVKHWEIGNETWGWWTPGWTSNAQAFANSYVEFRDAMYAKDSSLEFIGEGGDGNSTDQSWNRTMVQTAGSKLDHLSIHYYPPQSLPQNYNSGDVYLASVGAPATINDRLSATRDTVLDYSDEDIKVAVTEWNAMYFNEEHRRTRTLEAALQVAGMINLFARRPELSEINFVSTLVDFWDGGGIRLGNRGVFVTPSHEVMRLFGNNFGRVLLKTDVVSSTYDAPAIGNLPARSGVPYLDATATMSADGSRMYLSVVNRHPSSDLATTINLNNAGTIGSSATLHRLNSASYLDQNTWQNTNQVAVTTSTLTGVSSSFSHSFPAHSYSLIVFTTSAGSVSTPRLIGQVTTATGSPVAGATVQVGSVGTGTTDNSGYYSIAVSSPGTYTVTASAPGYQPASLANVEVHAEGATALPLRLSP